MCHPGEGRTNPADKCQPIDKTPLVVRVVLRNSQPIYYSSEYGSDKNDAYVEFANEFKKNMKKAVGSTNYASCYVNTDVSYITAPKTVNRCLFFNNILHKFFLIYFIIDTNLVHGQMAC